MTETPLSVLFLIPSLQGGGAERVFVSLLRHFDRKKFKLTLAVIDTRDAAYRDLIPEDVEFIDLQCTRVLHALPRIVRLVHKRRPNLVLSTLGHLNLALAIIRPVLPSWVRFIGRESIIVSLLSISYKVPIWWNWAYRKFYPSLDKIICQSNDMRQDLISTYGIHKSKIVVINNPVDVEYINTMSIEGLPFGLFDFESSNEDAVHLVAAGRLSHQKGFDILVKALAICKDGNFFLTILGEGEAHEELRELSVQYGVSNRIHFAGFQSNPFSIIARADAFILSSRFEGFPNVILEALACGTPVISTPAVGGVKEILNGVEGCFIAEDFSPHALASLIKKITPGYRVPIEVLKPYRASFIVSQYEDLLCDVIFSDLDDLTVS